MFNSFYIFLKIYNRINVFKLYTPFNIDNMVSYKMDCINDIRDNMDNFVLEKDTQTIIDALTILLGLNIQNKTKGIKKDRGRSTCDKPWSRKEEFKATIMKKDEGSDEILNAFRGILNKITSNNYDAQIEKIYECINELMELQDDKHDDIKKYEKIIEYLFNIVINNRVYANIYARLYSDLLDTYILLDDHRGYFIDNYRDSLTHISYVNPDEDYDKFCQINKQNEQRKALLSFLIYSIPTEVHSFEDVKTILLELFDNIEINENNKSSVSINEEIIENIFVIFSDGRLIINKEVSKYELINKITSYSKYKVSDHPGFSNRMKFKCMDILDLYK